GKQCTTQPSCRFEPSSISIRPMSPRNEANGPTKQPGPITTSPIRHASGWTKASGLTTGTTPPSAYAGMSRQPFNDHGHTLPTGRAHGLQADLLVPPLQTMQERGRDSGTSHP